MASRFLSEEDQRLAGVLPLADPADAPEDAAEVARRPARFPRGRRAGRGRRRQRRPLEARPAEHRPDLHVVRQLRPGEVGDLPHVPHLRRDQRVRIAVVGAGVVGLCLARALRRRGLDPLVLERAPAGAYRPRPFMPPYHGFDALDDAGVLDAVRAVAWPIAPQADGTPVALAASFVRVSEILADGVPVEHEHEVTGLLRDGERVAGVRVRDPAGARARRAGRPGGGVRRRALAGARDGGHRGRDHACRGRPPVVHEPGRDRPLLRAPLPGRRAPGGPARVARRLGRLVGHRALRARRGARPRPRRVPRRLHPAHPRGRARPSRR